MADIELVIKMPEEKYKWIKENNPKADKNSIVGAIANSTPLPKGHGRLIDADKAILEAIMRTKYSVNHKYMECVIEHIKFEPTIIEADKKGEQE